MKIKKLAIVLAVFVMIYTHTFANTIKGKITDKKGNPVSYANIFIKNASDGSMTDDQGSFAFETNLMGQQTLIISHISFEKVEKEVNLSEVSLNLDFQLEQTFVQMDQVTVSASSFSASDEEGKTLNSLDIYTTAGAEADVLKAIQTFPGVTQVDESAGLFVRGGDASETVMYLDGATLSHPYKYESDQGGYYGMLTPWHLKGTYFSSGAFSAKYGNALSGVLAMESLDRPDTKAYEFGVGLAAVSLGFYAPVNDKLGVRFAGNYSDTQALFKVNGADDSFDRFPVSFDGNMNLTFMLSKKTRLKYFIYGTQDEIKAEFKSPTYQGFFTSENENLLNALQITSLFSQNFSMKTAVSVNSFGKSFSLSGIEIDTDDHSYRVRSDFMFQKSKKLIFNYGFEINQIDTDVSGQYALDDNNLSEYGKFVDYSHHYNQLHHGYYVESEYYLSRKLVALGGVRLDASDDNDKNTIDPRISVIYQVNGSNSLKLASGIYHQFPTSQFIDGNYGGAKLSPMKAVHYVAGYELKNDAVNFKSEFYYKDYKNLPLEYQDHHYNSKGFGYSYGSDFFLKGNLPFISGWLSYSFLKTERKELDRLKLSPGNYDIRHNFVAALKKYFNNGQSWSITYKIHSGKPYTAALNQWNQKRLSAVQGLDLSWSLYQSYRGNNFIVYYASISNLLDSKNTYGYYFSPDYSEKTEINSTFGRTYYFGISLSLGKLPSI
ncbi:MAG: TonB-dependent receptor [Candidatus Marinimicrobia bacterium]|nr:TonB-dependent receptor [Candidatus Neomarinimicrobiota bacterium]